MSVSSTAAIFIALPLFVIAHEKRQASSYVRSGIVPIFGDQTHNPPLTFTFTTPIPRANTQPSYFVNIDVNSINSAAHNSIQNAPLITLNDPNLQSIPIVLHTNSKTVENLIRQKPRDFQTLNGIPSSSLLSNSVQQSPPRHTFDPKTFRFVPIQSQSEAPLHAMNAPPTEQEKWTDEYNRIWSKMGQSWHEMKEGLSKSGIERDWKGMLAKITNTVEPYMYTISEQIGDALNTVVRQQQSGVLQKGTVLNKMQTSLGRMVRGEQPAADTVAQLVDTLFGSGAAAAAAAAQHDLKANNKQ